jgi:hypothetical protein
VELEGGVVTRKDEYWRKVKIRFDIEENKCDVTIGGVKVLDDVKFEGVTIPRTVCVGVCAGTADGHNNHICVNKLNLRELEEGEVIKQSNISKENDEAAAEAARIAAEEAAAAEAARIAAEEAAAADSGTGIPAGCTDWKVEDGQLVTSDQEEDWRGAGHTFVGYGFELTQDEDDQEVCNHCGCMRVCIWVGLLLMQKLCWVCRVTCCAECLLKPQGTKFM